MHFALGILFVIVGIVIATRRLRPTWWTTLALVLIGIGLVWSILVIVGVAAQLGKTTWDWIGWIFVALCAATMLSSIFVLERRGPGGVEQAPIIGDNPFDGDTDDSDDPAAQLAATEHTPVIAEADEPHAPRQTPPGS